METQTYLLDSTTGTRACYEHRDSVPPIEKCFTFKLGDYVQLRFLEKGRRAELMWVEITQVRDGGYMGKLDNDPVQLLEIQCGDSVDFTAYDIFRYLDENGKRVPA
jgi:uncharacterized protein YegJ (DUF2314 family)